DVMGELPEYDLDGSIEGTVEFDEEEHHYILNLDVNLTNNLEDDLTDVYSAFPLPEDIAVLETDEDIGLLPAEDGTGEVAFKLPDIEAEESVEYNLEIPIIGQTDEVVQSSSINLYKITEEGYWQLGEIAGEIN